MEIKKKFEKNIFTEVIEDKSQNNQNKKDQNNNNKIIINKEQIEDKKEKTEEKKKEEKEIRDLKYQLLQKDNEINNLKSKSQNNNEKNKQVLNMDEIMIVYFQTQDQEINHVGIKCLPSDTFADGRLLLPQ